MSTAGSATVILILFAAGLLFDVPQLWGINLGRFISGAAAPAVLVLVALLMWDTISRPVMSRLDRFSILMAERKRLRLLMVTGIAALATLLFAWFYSVTSLLGDATLRLNQVEDGLIFLPTEIGDFLLHTLLYRVIFLPHEIIAERCYNIVSIACGPFFVIGCWRLSAYLRSHQSLILFMAMLSSGMTAFFFGYMESYSILGAMLPYLVLSALKVVDGRSSRISFVWLYLVAGLIHSASLFLFLGVLLLIWNLPRDPDEVVEKRLHRGLIGFFLILLMVACLLSWSGWFGLERFILSPFGQKGYRLGLFTVLHAFNVLNWLLLSALPFVLLLPILVMKPARDSSGDRRRIMLAFWLMVPAAMIILFFTPQLGGPRDWDLFSLPAFILIPASLIAYFARFNRSLPSHIMPVIVVAAFTTFSFAVTNSSPVRAVDRFVEIIETSRFKNQIHEYVSLMDHAKQFPRLSHRRLEFALKAWDQPPYKQADSNYVLNYLNWMTHYRSQDGHVPVNLPQILASDSTNISRQSLLAEYFLRFGKAGQLTWLADRLQRVFPDHPEALRQAATIYLKLNRVDRCGEAFQRAYRLDSSDVSILIGFAAYQYQVEDYERAVQLLERAVMVNRSSFLANHNLAVAYIELKRIESAVEYLARAESLIASKSHARMVKRTMGLLQRRVRQSTEP
jgi:thioredoxin-like negative regulator of GroEL